MMFACQKVCEFRFRPYIFHLKQYICLIKRFSPSLSNIKKHTDYSRSYPLCNKSLHGHDENAIIHGMYSVDLFHNRTAMIDRLL